MRGSINDKKIENRFNEVLEKIIYRRKRLGLSQTDMSEKLEITLSGYYKIEKGKSKLGFIRLLEISEVLEVEIEYFLNKD
jgi:transcriptional regulator with XRE-family HTH domain